MYDTREKTLYTDIDFDKITYIKYLNKLIVINPNLRNLNTDDYYLYYDSDVDRYLLLKYKYTYPKKVNTASFETSKGVEIFNHSIIFIFSIIKDFKRKEDITSYTIRMSGFTDVIDDRNYIYDIPLVNELFHNDNYILSHTNYRLCGNLSDTIDSFNITWESYINPCVVKMGYYDKHHKEK